jgi:hypothetical protein
MRIAQGPRISDDISKPCGHQTRGAVRDFYPILIHFDSQPKPTRPPLIPFQTYHSSDGALRSSADLDGGDWSRGCEGLEPSLGAVSEGDGPR